MSTALTAAELRFAESPQGRSQIARERYVHSLVEGHRGTQAAPWNDAMEASAVRRLAMQNARGRVQAAAFLADSARELPALQARAETARQQMIEGRNSKR